MSNGPRLRINEIAFSTNERDDYVGLDFSSPFSFIYGASNTGKSFAVKAIDFMLGGSRDLPDIQERKPYQLIQMELGMEAGTLHLERAIAGGDFAMHGDGVEARILSSRHNKDNEGNLSNFLLGRLDMEGKEVAKDKSGTKKALSFRDIVRLCIVDETAIQSEISPAESGDVTLRSLERNIFKYMLTGEDDAALITQVKAKDYATGRTAQVRMLEEMLLEIDAEISDSFPDAEELDDKLETLQDELDRLEKEISFARESAQGTLAEKHKLVQAIGEDQRRANDVSVTLESFAQLMQVYESDVARLEAIEEAGFLLGLHGDDSCPVCGAAPEAQTHEHALSEIEAARAAAEIEIAKIRAHQSELVATVSDTQSELERTGARLLRNRERLFALEAELAATLPASDASLEKLSEIIPKRDRIRRGLELSQRRAALAEQKTRVEKQKQGRRPSNVQTGLSTSTAREFANEVGKVLQAWRFPGECQTFFDVEGDFDLIIDGKRRRNNGKGVRAITHAAFKVALLVFCQTRGLPHPGFLVLDTPLITYRDPIRSRGGELDVDEAAIKQSDLKERMFEYLGSLGSIGQFIVFDNVDPPPGASRFAALQTFTNDIEEGRQGLL